MLNGVINTNHSIGLMHSHLIPPPFSQDLKPITNKHPLTVPTIISPNMTRWLMTIVFTSLYITPICIIIPYFPHKYLFIKYFHIPINNGIMT